MKTMCLLALLLCCCSKSYAQQISIDGKSIATKRKLTRATYTYNYDDSIWLNKLVEKTTHIATDSSIVIEDDTTFGIELLYKTSRRVNTFNNNRQLTETKVYRDGILKSHTRREYDEEGREIKIMPVDTKTGLPAKGVTTHKYTTHPKSKGYLEVCEIYADGVLTAIDSSYFIKKGYRQNVKTYSPKGMDNIPYFTTATKEANKNPIEQSMETEGKETDCMRHINSPEFFNMQDIDVATISLLKDVKKRVQKHKCSDYFYVYHMGNNITLTFYSTAPKQYAVRGNSNTFILESSTSY